MPYALASFSIRALPAPGAAPRYPHPIEPETPGNGPHLSYAIQWFFFAALFLAGIVLVARGPRPARAPSRGEGR